MALPYPEGEVFFKRSVLKNNGHNLDPDNLTSFNSHALIEWCWNEQAIGSGFARNRICHVSGKYSSKEQYAHWNAMIVSFGTKEGFEKLVSAGSDGRHDSRHSGIKREVSTVLPSDTDEYEKGAKGGPLMTAITPVKLHPDQPYMYIDLNVPIRAVYFPLAQKPSTVFPDLCSYLMVDFRMRQSVFMYDRVDFEAREEVNADELQDESQDEYLKAIYQAQKQEREAQARELEEALKGCKDPKRKYEQKPEWYYDAHGLAVKVMEFDLYSGLGSLPDYMISLYIPGIYNYLILPRQLRSVERGLFMPQDPTKSLIRVRDRGAINSGSTFIKPEYIEQKLSFGIDMTKILEGHFGVQVVWQPFDIPKPEDANQMMIDMVEAGLCFVPVIGPLASNCFGLFMDIVNNPEAFKEANPFEMSGYLLGDAAAAAEGIADGLPKYSKAGKIAGFLGKLGGALTKISNPDPGK